MYLSESIISLEGQNYPMCGVLSASVKMTTQLQRFGYAQVCYNGTQSRCHEFHRSMIVENRITSYNVCYTKLLRIAYIIRSYTIKN